MDAKTFSFRILGPPVGENWIPGTGRLELEIGNGCEKSLICDTRSFTLLRSLSLQRRVFAIPLVACFAFYFPFFVFFW